MSSEPVHLFLNPTAGRGKAAARGDRIIQILQESQVTVELIHSEGVRDLEDKVHEYVSAGTTRVVVAGGDGSIHEATNGIMASGKACALGVIPIGTGNDFAKACDIPLDWEQATRLLAERIAADQMPRCVDVGCFNDRFFANSVGIGFDAKVTKIARSIRLPIGDLVYLIAAFQAMLDGVTTPHLEIRADGFEWQDRMTLVSINNGAWVGGMFPIAPMADNADGRLELVMAKPIGRRNMLKLLPRLISGTHLESNEILHHSITRLSAQSAEPIPSHLDGEVQPLQSRFDIEILPDALRLL